MKFTRFVGVDPGAKGAIAVLGEHGEFMSVVDMPGDLLGLLWVALGLPEVRPTIGAIENPRQPNDGRSVASAQELGRWIGACQMMLLSRGVDTLLPRPQDWKRGVFFKEYGGKPPKGPLDKKACRALAERIFGAGVLGKRKTEDRSEALLIARWLYHTMGESE